MFAESRSCPDADPNPVGDAHAGTPGHTNPGPECTTDANGNSDSCADAAAYRACDAAPHRPPDTAAHCALPGPAITDRDTESPRGPPDGRR